MAGNDFDLDVMPSSRSARAKQRRMLRGVPVYIAVTAALAVSILTVIALAAIA
jgi:hypothetical protein